MIQNQDRTVPRSGLAGCGKICSMNNPNRSRPANRIQIGLAGEALARRHLERLGFQILETRWRCRAGEIDIVARQGTDLVFVEVRARRDSDLDLALESISARKRKRLLTLASAYLEAHQLPEDTVWRIDVAAVCFPFNRPARVEIIEDAVGW